MSELHFIQKKMDQMTESCREHGLPVTVQRRAVMESLAGRKDHPTADQVYDELKERLPGLSRTTVYRVLEGFVNYGLALKVSVAQAKSRFDAETRRHHHLECLCCGAVHDLHDPSLDDIHIDLSAHDMDIVDFSISFRGRCSACTCEAGTTTKEG